MNPAESTYFTVLANVVLVTHFLFVLFVVGGQLFIVLGCFARWSWARHRLFRIIHLVATGYVVLQSWVGMVCPLTKLENTLRREIGDPEYARGFIAHWLREMLYYDAPGWVFVLLYTIFAIIVGLSFVLCRPFSRQKPDDKHFSV